MCDLDSPPALERLAGAAGMALTRTETVNEKTTHQAEFSDKGGDSHMMYVNKPSCDRQTTSTAAARVCARVCFAVPLSVCVWPI